MVDVAIIVPTFNERENVRETLDRLNSVLKVLRWEVIFVDDDSPDGTAELLREISSKDPRVRIIQRVNRPGLASACIEGMMSSAVPYIAAMDADLQHDESILPEMFARLCEKNLDAIIGSRNVAGGSVGKFALWRVALSVIGKRFSRTVCRCEIEDPMSGFFILTRSFLDEVVHQTSGFKFWWTSWPRPRAQSNWRRFLTH